MRSLLLDGVCGLNTLTSKNALITYISTIILKSRAIYGREREVVVGGCRSLVAEHLWLKPEALGSIPGDTTFLSFPLPFQRSMDSNGPDYLYRSSDLGEPHLSVCQCCDKSSRFFRNQKHTQQLSPIYQHQKMHVGEGFPRILWPGTIVSDCRCISESVSIKGL